MTTTKKLRQFFFRRAQRLRYASFALKIQWRVWFDWKQTTMKMKTTTLFSLLLCATVTSLAAPIAPTSNDGRKLNLDFETGTLKDWTSEGDAFEKQPVRGDTVAKRNGPGGTSGHQGEFWMGGYEFIGDDGTGTLTSIKFKATHRWASFLIAGGDWEKTRVELVDAESGKVFFKATGQQSEHLRPIVVDLEKQFGKEIFIRLVDEQKGHWGHINFDDFKFHAERPKFANEIDPKKKLAGVPEADAVLFEGLSPEEAAEKMTVPPGFKATLFAGEPDVMQPIAFCLDHRGRLWVAEAYTYPKRAPEGEGKDRIIVLEDTDDDGKFNRRTVFMEGLNLVSGIEYGFGGVYVGAAPYLMFIPIEDGDAPKPAGKPEILLDGWGHQDTHETLNTFKWGPDGWLYGCQGVFTHSNVGKPGAPDSERTKINAGVWRFHPTKKIFELFAEGTSNPWGFDFDQHGQLLAEACVIPHLFHLAQGGRYHRQSGSHFNPFTYDDIKTCADHVHWAGEKGPHAGNNRSDSAGGGHAHAGLLIYQGDNWPEEYRGKIFIGNIHGQRINMDIPERKGSGFVAKHGKDMINFNDKWSQVIDFRTGPDGGVYFIDWYDKNQCHHHNDAGHDRSNGRIYKVVYGEPKFEKVDLEKLSNKELLQNYLFHSNDWYARHVLRILKERLSRGELDEEARWLLYTASFQGTPGTLGKPLTIEYSVAELRLIWALHVIDGLKTKDAALLLKWELEFARVWAIQFLCEDKKVSPEILKEFARLAREDKSPVVRLYLASALQRLPVSDRWEIVEGLLSHAEDWDDPNLRMMVWYGAEPLVAEDAKRALSLAAKSELTRILEFTTRRVAALNTPEAFAAIVKTLLPLINVDDQREFEILGGLQAALKGQRSVAMPEGWLRVEEKYEGSRNPDLRVQVQALSLTFGSANALASLRKRVMDDSQDLSVRRTALESLLSAKDKDLAPLLHQLLKDEGLRGAALRGLASYDDSETPANIIAAYESFDTMEKRDALNTLSSRAAFAKPLLASVADGKVSRKDLSADLIRQLRSLKNDEVNQQLEKVYGAIRESSADKQKEIEKYRKMYRAGGSQPGDASRGRLVYSKTCQQCHLLFDVGGAVGPDLTGSNRGDLDYILENMVDPNAVIPHDYQTSTLETKDDRVMTGIVKSQDENSVTLITANETVTIPRNEIASLSKSQLSMMPEGLLEPLSEQEVRDLIYYLRQPGQVPLSEARK